MGKYSRCIFFVLLILIASFIKGINAIMGGFEKYSEYSDRIPTDITPQTSVRSLLHCSAICSTDTNCEGFQYNYSTKECRSVTTHVIQYAQNVYGSTFYRRTKPNTWTPIICPETDDEYITAVSKTSTFTIRIVNMEVSQIQAKTICENNGEKLVKIDTAEKNAYIINVLRTCTVYKSNYWIDGTKDTAVTFKFTDGTAMPMDKTFWGEHQPDNLQKDGICVRMSMSFNYLRTDRLCRLSSGGFICEV